MIRQYSDVMGTPLFRWVASLFRSAYGIALLMGVSLATGCGTTEPAAKPAVTNESAPREYVADRVLPGSKVRMAAGFDANGTALRFLVEQVCVSETKRTSFETGTPITKTVERRELPCNRRPLVGGNITVKGVQGNSLQSGRTETDGTFRLRWEELTPIELVGLSGGQALVDVQGRGTVGTIDFTPARSYIAHAIVEEAKGLAAQDKVDEAREVSRQASGLGIDVAEIQAAIDAAPSAVRQAHADAETHAEIEKHLESAKRAIERNDPDAAYPELDKAMELGADVGALYDAAADTPKARRDAKAAERAEEREKRQGERAAAAEKAAADRASAAANVLSRSLEKKFHLRSPSPSSAAMPDIIMRNSAGASHGCAEAELGWILTPKIVQKVGPDEYEVLLTIIHFGGNEEYPIILHATRSKFESTGRLGFPFPCILAKYGTREVELRNGFHRERMVVVEDPRPREEKQ